MTASAEVQSVRCAIAGGGPAGMMLGFLLARAGVSVVVLEKHADFLRDFRGDTIHPSTMEVLGELGLLDEFLRLPHQEVRQLRGWVGDVELTVADFTHLPVRCPFIAFIPQWDFLDFLVRHAAQFPSFALRMQAEATDLIEESGRVAGVRATTAAGTLEIRADLVIGADGRHSVIRERAGLVVEDLGAPMDVLWFRLPKRPEDPMATMGRFDAGRIVVMLNRGDYWQLGYVIPKGSAAEIRVAGLDRFREGLATATPFLRDRVDELRTWDDVKLLTVSVDRLRRWYRPGLLCIGDAAHAMSPVGGVGINLAIQDAVAAANRLAAPLREGRVTLDDLEAVQRRRLLPTRVTQRLQVLVQRRLITRVLAARESFRAPLVVRLLARFPGLSRIPARLVGTGIRPEHVEGSQRLPTDPLVAPR
jgi:2-polyprenyl-6-methoxyphenol hydroxylase-like FAD-dependent oxidoreductase